MFWVNARNRQMVPMPASLEHMPARLHCNLHLHLHNDNNCSNLQQLLSMVPNNICLRSTEEYQFFLAYVSFCAFQTVSH